MIYVLSDIHGNERRFDSVLKQIDLQPEDTLYILGDVVDRHPGGIRILQRIMAMENVKMILGNHEYMMLRALGCPVDDNLDEGGARAHWYRNGGRVTHEQLKALPLQESLEILEYLYNLPLNLDVTVNGKHYKLAHGAPAEAYDQTPKYRNETYFAVWKRLDADYVPDWDYTLVFGHTPTIYFQSNFPMDLWYGQGRICIDCGCGYPDDDKFARLACLRLDDGKVFYSEEVA